MSVTKCTGYPDMNEQQNVAKKLPMNNAIEKEIVVLKKENMSSWKS